MIALSGCSIYKPDIQQGNVLESKKIEKLKTGMTKRQILFLMGTALLKDPFHKNRWDYIHTLKKSDEDMTIQRLTLYFENDLLVRIDNSQLQPRTIE